MLKKNLSHSSCEYNLLNTEWQRKRLTKTPAPSVITNHAKRGRGSAIDASAPPPFCRESVSCGQCPDGNPPVTHTKKEELQVRQLIDDSLPVTLYTKDHSFTSVLTTALLSCTIRKRLIMVMSVYVAMIPSTECTEVSSMSCLGNFLFFFFTKPTAQANLSWFNLNTSKPWWDDRIGVTYKINR